MRHIICFFIILFFAVLTVGCSTVTRPIPVNDLAHYKHYPNNVKKVISKASLLSKKHLKYIFGSDNPKNGGMDCSGVIYYLLRSIEYINIPRSSYEMYVWLERERKIHYVTSHHFYSSQFNALKPGDLLFWTSTYRTRRKPPITHVMLYLGKNKNNQPLMFGSSDGIYNGTEILGVSVFDFVLPRKGDRSHFVAYGCIPSFTC